MKSTESENHFARLRPIHPFPARMAPEIALSRLRSRRKLRVLDPMAGSGTSLILAKLLKHTAVGYDQDPLALVIAQTWCSKVHERRFREALLSTLAAAKSCWLRAKPYPSTADAETRKFLRYWFDFKTRKKLAALAAAIGQLSYGTLRTQLWCAFSRLIIVKDNGVSLARDVAHSRPHRTYERAPLDPFVQFPKAGEHIIRILLALPKTKGRVYLGEADARNLPAKSGSIDFVITSPPYLNAIDYLRGHRMSLVWMGYTLRDLRHLRSRSVGTETGYKEIPSQLLSAKRAIGRVTAMPPRMQRIVNKYIVDMSAIMAEIKRVLRPLGQAIIVIGNSTVRGVFLRNSDMIVELGRIHGLKLRHRRRRQIPKSKRYLPPPSSQPAATALASRMRTEDVLTFTAIA
jgi:hypothetical protein